MDDPAELPLFAVGIATGGLSDTNRGVFAAVNAFQLMAARERERFGSAGVRLNLNFEIPGPLFSPARTGTRLARFDRSRGWAVVVCSLPVGIDVASIPTFLVEVLDVSMELVKGAVQRGRKRNGELEVTTLAQLVAHLKVLIIGNLLS